MSCRFRQLSSTLSNAGAAVSTSTPLIPNQLPEANILRLCIDKAIWNLGWRPCWSVYQSLEKTADWYQAYLQDPDNARNISLAQIREYEEALAAPLPELSSTAAPH